LRFLSFFSERLSAWTFRERGDRCPTAPPPSQRTARSERIPAPRCCAVVRYGEGSCWQPRSIGRGTFPLCVTITDPCPEALPCRVVYSDHLRRFSRIRSLFLYVTSFFRGTLLHLSFFERFAESTGAASARAMWLPPAVPVATVPPVIAPQDLSFPWGYLFSPCFRPARPPPRLSDALLPQRRRLS